MGSYTSSQLYGAQFIELQDDLQQLPLPQPGVDGLAIPIYLMQGVQISEQFSPLIGINLRTTSNWQVRADYKRGREMTLNLGNAQVTEMRTSDLTLDFGYTATGLNFRLFGTPIVLDKELTFKAAITSRNNFMVQRDIGEAPTVTAGNRNLQIRPTISYRVDSRADVQLYFERTVTDPYLANSFRNARTAFGIRVRYGLMQ